MGAHGRFDKSTRSLTANMHGSSRSGEAVSEAENKPFSSRSLIECYELGAERIGWAQRTSDPRSMRDGRLLIGTGTGDRDISCFPCACERQGTHPGRRNGRGRSSCQRHGARYIHVHDAGSCRIPGVAAEQVRLRLGTTAYPPTPSQGGSWTMASVGSAIRAACLEAKLEATKRAIADQGRLSLEPRWRLSNGRKGGCAGEEILGGRGSPTGTS